MVVMRHLMFFLGLLEPGSCPEEPPQAGPGGVVLAEPRATSSSLPQGQPCGWVPLPGEGTPAGGQPGTRALSAELGRAGRRRAPPVTAEGPVWSHPGRPPAPQGLLSPPSSRPPEPLKAAVPFAQGSRRPHLWTESRQGRGRVGGQPPEDRAVPPLIPG